jgi:hypothetical protein
MKKTLAAVAALVLMGVMGSALTGQTATSAPASKNVEELKAVLAAAGADAKAGKYDKLLALVSDDLGKALKPMLVAGPELQAKIKQLKETAAAKEIVLPEAMTRDMADGPAVMVPGIAPILNADSAKFEEKDGIVGVSLRGSLGLFKKTDKGWAMEVPEEAQLILPLLPDILVAETKLIDALQAGIEKGDITKDNFTASGKALSDTIMRPVMKKLMAAAMAKMTVATAPAASQPAGATKD